MKVNLNVPFVDYKGNPIKDEKGNVTIIADMVAESLFTLTKIDDKRIEPAQMVACYKLARRIVEKPNEIELSAKEIAFIEELMSKILVVGCYGQLYEILEGNV